MSSSDDHEPIIDGLIKDDAFMDKVITANIILMRKRLEKYKQFTTNAQSLVDSYNAKLAIGDSMLAGQDQLKDAYKVYADRSFNDNLSKFIDQKASVDTKKDKITKIIDEVCGKTGSTYEAYRTLRRGNIQTAISKLRQKVSGSGPDIKNIRKKVEMLLVELAYSWSSFSESYTINFTLVGGAGVGKTTLAERIAECVQAFGLVATNYYDKVEVSNLIGQYIGHTSKQTNSILYRALEGTLFIDEAYSIMSGGAEDGNAFGKECIDEIVNFTQKFQGHLCFIVAGYKKNMDESFFAANEGLRRRFPNVISMQPYVSSDLINAIVQRVLKVDAIGKDESKEITVRKSLNFFNIIFRLIYLDTKRKTYDDYFKFNHINPKKKTDTYNFLEKDQYKSFSFNLIPFIRTIYFSNSINKRGLMKAYIMKFIFNMEEPDLFKNQMGDTQNIGSMIMQEEWFTKELTPSLNQLVELMNKFIYVRNRETAIVCESRKDELIEFDLVSGRLLTGHIKIHLCGSDGDPIRFDNKFIKPFLRKLIDDESIDDDKLIDELLRNYQEDDDLTKKKFEKLKRNIGKEYTTAVRELYKYYVTDNKGVVTKKMPAYVDSDFLEMEHKKIESSKSSTFLEYIDLQESENKCEGLITLGAKPRKKDFVKDLACKTDCYINPIKAELEGVDCGMVPPEPRDPPGVNPGVGGPPAALPAAPPAAPPAAECQVKGQHGHAVQPCKELPGKAQPQAQLPLAQQQQQPAVQPGAVAQGQPAVQPGAVAQGRPKNPFNAINDLL